MATRTIAAAGGLWSATGTWDEGAVPTTSDDVVARGDGTSGNVTVDTNAATCRSAVFTNYAATLTQSANLTIGGTTIPASGNVLLLVAGMTFTRTAGTLIFTNTSAGQKITWAGKQPGAVTIGASGSAAWTMIDNLTMVSATTAFMFTRGTLDLTGLTLSVGVFQSNGTLTRTLTLTNATINVGTTTATSTVVDMAAGTGLTLSASGCTFNITAATSGGIRTVATGGKSIGTVNYTNTGTSGLTFTGDGTLAALSSTGAARTLTLPAAATLTVSTVPTVAAGANIVSSSSDSTATLSVASGTLQVERAIIQDVTASGGATFNAINSKDVSGNSGWTFSRRARGWGLAA